nr:DUF6443 domain-containing protein [uncultured Flavobacterium sp.]
MKKYKLILILILALLSNLNNFAQTLSDENFIYTAAPQKAVKASSFNTLTKDEVIPSVTYFDGLGRPKQSVGIRAGVKSDGSATDIITHIGYDNFGRQDKEYLPYTDGANSGIFRTGDIDLATKSYYTGSYPADINAALPNPYSQKEFEASPLNRVLKQAAPGYDWRLGGSHEIKLNYQSNRANDSVKNFAVNLSFSDNTYWPTLTQSSVNSGFYDVNELYKTVTYDENTGANPTDEIKGSTVEFKNKQGQVLLKRTYGAVGAGTTNEKHDTYYVYDDYGNLTYVIPPKAADNITTNPSSNIQTNLPYSGTVPLGTTLALTATNSITLTNFYAPAGSTFSAKIVPGGNPILDELCYQYVYDNRNRLVEKKLPGKEWEYIVYDKLDRPVLTQDANLRAQNKWLFTKYDAFGRPVYTGEYTDTAQRSRIDIQTVVNGSAILFETKQGTNTINVSTVYYSNTVFPNINDSNINLFTINYYDDYSFDKPADVPSITLPIYGVTPISNAKGLATGSKVRILGSTSWITNVGYYDSKSRPIYSYSKNDFLTTTSTIKSQLDFVGKTLETTSTHLRNNITTTVVDNFTYDNAGRLSAQKQKINNQDQEIIAANSYDELGQLTSKGIGGKATQSRLQTVDYSYNIRGWLKGINDSDTSNSAITMGAGDLFGFQINYDNPSAGTPLYNGNISQTFWKNQTSSLKNYDYSYDALNRLKSAVSQDAGRYNESLRYDKNGNITKLFRTGYKDNAATQLGTMDDLVYGYDGGNKLFSVEDSSGSTEGFKDGIHTVQEYTYDANGNMKKDDNKGITAIAYNHLNLPTDVTLAGGTIHYDYDAAGVKQRKIAPGITTDYAGGFQYEKIGTNIEVLKFFPTAEGYAEYNSGTFSYIYQYKDHLGNVRLSYKDVGTTTPSLQIVEESNYYPFGMKQKVAGELVNLSGYKYKYNGKELQDELGLNVYDYGMRNYDSALGRFFNMDRFSEKYYDVNPYQYCVNNPLRFIDINGDSISVDKSVTQNWALNKVMTLYAGTKAGRKFLSQFASKGQTVFGQTFDKDGKYDKAGLNLEFTTMREDDENANTPANGETSDDGKNNITVALNTFERVDAQDNKVYDYRSPNAVTSANNMSRWIFSRTITAFHETFIHVDLSAKDFMDNRKFDNSNILYKPDGYKKHWQHSQVLYNNGNNTSWPNDASKGIQEANSTFGRFYNTGQLNQMMWNYTGGKK